MPLHHLPACAKPCSQGEHLPTSQPTAATEHGQSPALAAKGRGQTSVLLHYVVAGIGIEGSLSIPAFAYIKAKHRQL